MLEDILDSAKTIATAVGQKTQELVSYSKKKLSCIELENELQRNYAKLGKVYFALLQEADEKSTEVEELISEINRLEEELTECKKQDCTENSKYCTQCGSENSAESVFCCKCGHKL
ncbi:MAG: hypothetical protein K5917_04720 [Clostridiales bacterium]|nr:hypothetical protein [Clostridiales bacterium]